MRPVGTGEVLPTGYKRVEYLESTGTQYINTQENVYRLTLDFQATSLDDADRRVYFGLYDALNIQTQDLTYQLKRSSASGVHGVQVGTTKLTSPYLYGVPFRITIDGDGNVSRDGEKIGIVTLPQENKPNATPFIWAQATHYGTYIASAEHHTVARVFSVTLGRDGQITRKFIPCLDPTRAPCMYDTVSRQPFYNSGTGDFLYPSEATTYALRRRVLPDWGKLTENGLRRLYHSPEGYQGELIDYALENGFKPIVESGQPEDGYWSPRWIETENEIVLKWVEIEPPTEP